MNKPVPEYLPLFDEGHWQINFITHCLFTSKLYLSIPRTRMRSTSSSQLSLLHQISFIGNLPKLYFLLHKTTSICQYGNDICRESSLLTTTPRLVATTPCLVATTPCLVATTPCLVATTPCLVATTPCLVATTLRLLCSML